jgi:hypothetical protein
MLEMLGLTFRQNIIDVYIAPWFNAISDPLVIGVSKSPSEFVDSLTHELLHRLLTDNNEVSGDVFLIPEWQAMFGEEYSFVATVHIPVHALHKAIYLDVLGEPERLGRDIKSCHDNNSVDYVAAWGYVESHDYKKIVCDLAEMYGRLGENAYPSANIFKTLDEIHKKYADKLGSLEGLDAKEEMHKHWIEKHGSK